MHGVIKRIYKIYQNTVISAKCSIDSIKFDFCINNNANCHTVTQDRNQIHTKQKFLSDIIDRMENEFNMGILANVESSAPKSLMDNFPEYKEILEHDSLPLKLEKLPVLMRCLPGSTMHNAKCFINNQGNYPTMACETPKVNDIFNSFVNKFGHLENKLKCNTEYSLIDWKKTDVIRRVKIEKEDKVEIYEPKIHLNLSYCNMGFIEMPGSLLPKMTLEDVSFNSKILSTKCYGETIRPKSATLLITPKIKGGLIKINCENQETCLINTANSDRCNITVRHRSEIKCEYGKGKEIFFKCNQLKVGKIVYSGGNNPDYHISDFEESHKSMS